MVSEIHKYDVDFDTAFDLALKIAKEHFNIKKYSRSEGEIECSTGATLRSWGENVNIFVRRINDSKTKIEVHSTAGSQLIDWGKSRVNVNLFFNTFKNLM